MKHAKNDTSPRYENAPLVSEMKPAVVHPDHLPDRKEIRRRRRSNGLIGAAVLLSLVLIAGGLGFCIITDTQSREETARIVAEREQEAQEAKEMAEAEAAQEAERAKREAIHNVTFAVSGVDYDQYATRIPVQFVGQTIDEQPFDEVVYINSSGAGLSVPAGSYTGTVVASPMASTGMLYTVSSPPMEFKITEDDPEDVSSGHAIVLIPIEADKLTQEMIDVAYDWAMKDPESAGKAETYKQAAETSMVESIARKKQADLEERQRRAQEFASEYFTNVIFTNQDDDSDVDRVGNWTEVVMAYVNPDSSLAQTLQAGPSKEYFTALDVNVTGYDEEQRTVTVDVSYAQSKKATSGWTDKKKTGTIVCTFDEGNMITKIQVTTPDGTKEY